MTAPPPLPYAHLLERAHQAVDHGDLRRARRILGKIGEGTPSPELAYAHWRVAWTSKGPAAALPGIEEAVVAFPESPDLHHALGTTLAQLDRPDDALVALEEACYLDADFAEAWYDLAKVRESVGDIAGMRAAFTEVYELDMAEPLPELVFSEDQMKRWVERAVDLLPPEVRERIVDVPIFVAEYPEPWILETEIADPRLLGLFDGPTWTELRSVEGAYTGAPHVYVFQRNLERVAPDPRTMAHEVRVTVHHELGHFLGLDEHDMHERGLE